MPKGGKPGQIKDWSGKLTDRPIPEQAATNEVNGLLLEVFQDVLCGQGPQMYPGKTLSAEPCFQLGHIQKGGAENLKGQGRPPSFGDIGAFPQYLSRIHQGRGEGG